MIPTDVHMDTIPATNHRLVLSRAIEEEEENNRHGGDTTTMCLPPLGGGGGHNLVRDYRCTCRLFFCASSLPSLSLSLLCSSSPFGAMLTCDNNKGYNGHHLETMKFLLPLDPGMQVPHYHYLVDALGIGDTNKLEEIDTLPAGGDNDGASARDYMGFGGRKGECNAP